MRDIRPWETKRLGPHPCGTRPWRPWGDRRIHDAVTGVACVLAVTGLWYLQGDAGLVVRKTVVTLASIVLGWCWRVCRAVD